MTSSQAVAFHGFAFTASESAAGVAGPPAEGGVGAVGAAILSTTGL
jgi:hypothetical protein